MSKNLYSYFSQKQSDDVLPSSVNNYLKEKLLEASKETNENDGEKTIKTEMDAVKLKAELEKANEKIKNLTMKLTKQNDDIKLLKHALKTSNRLCVSKDVKIERLLKERAKITVGKLEQKPVMFKKFEENIDPATLKKLRNIQMGQKQDSSFVLLLVRHFYWNDLSILFNRTASGKGKTPITPAKKTVMQEILKERVLLEESDEIHVDLRANRINILINDAIANITRLLKRVILHISKV